MASLTDNATLGKGAAVLRLESAGSALRDALKRQDWSTIGELDLQCRMAVEGALHDTGDEAALRSSLESLLVLYRELVGACQDEKQRIAAELRQVNGAHKGAKVYQMFT